MYYCVYQHAGNSEISDLLLLMLFATAITGKDMDSVLASIKQD